jgi:hypothetical protein
MLAEAALIPSPLERDLRGWFPNGWEYESPWQTRAGCLVADVLVLPKPAYPWTRSRSRRLGVIQHLKPKPT